MQNHFKSSFGLFLLYSLGILAEYEREWRKEDNDNTHA